MTAHAEDMVLVPPAELDALRAENRRLRREAGDREALERIWSDSGEGRTFTREELRRRGELVSDRALRFPDRTWDELEGLPQPLRNTSSACRWLRCCFSGLRFEHLPSAGRPE
jgi:hypothetical protein